MKAIEAIKTGWNLNKALRGNWDACADLLEIRRLNERATSAWTRGNNSGSASYMGKMDAVWDRQDAKAQAIAKRNGWKITQPGLWWTVADKNGNDITIRM